MSIFAALPLAYNVGDIADKVYPVAEVDAQNFDSSIAAFQTVWQQLGIRQSGIANIRANLLDIVRSKQFGQLRLETTTTLGTNLKDAPKALLEP